MGSKYRLAMCMVVSASLCAAADDSALAGYTGPDLVRAISREYAPARLVTDPFELWPALRALDVSPEGFVIDRYGTQRVACTPDAVSQPEGVYWLPITPWQWWTDVSSEVPVGVRHDLHNITLCNYDAALYRNSQSPGRVTRDVYRNEVWAVGYDRVDGEWVATYEPPKGYEGDFARAMMYMLCVHPCEGMRPFAHSYTVLSGTYPILTPRAAELLMTWHRSDPVDETELKRNASVETIQGNRNPFVDNPQLAEYLWGELASKPFVPDSQRERQPLKAVYSKAVDAVVDFYSPYVPEDAVWTVDGSPVKDNYTNVESLSVGRHTLRFSSPDVDGEMVIEITP